MLSCEEFVEYFLTLSSWAFHWGMAEKGRDKY